MITVEQNKIWQFDVDDTLILWNKSELPDSEPLVLMGPKGHTVKVHSHQKNINLLKKLAKVGWYIRVHSGSGWEWAKLVVEALGLCDYVDEITSKPLGNTDDKPIGSDLAFNVYRDPTTGKE